MNNFVTYTEEQREDINALVADAVKNSKAYVLRQLTSPQGDKEVVCSD